MSCKTTDQAQGAAQAIEDAAALAAVLPQGTTPAEVPERLKLYERIRYERAHKIQEHSRLAGLDWVGGQPVVDSKLPGPLSQNLPYPSEFVASWRQSLERRCG
jgi:2-polyprenyl-6-methoxyphenol hydroxylase-like FAD-dependent oxidoreductase